MIIPIPILVLILGALLISIVGMIILSNKKTPIDTLINSNTQLKSEIEDLKSKLKHSEDRRKNLLSINKGEKLLLTQQLVFGKGSKDEIKFTTYVECNALEVTDKKVKIGPYSSITDSNEINSDQARLKSIIDYLDQKWVDISDIEPIIDTQDRREDKLEELADILKS